MQHNKAPIYSQFAHALRELNNGRTRIMGLMGPQGEKRADDEPFSNKRDSDDYEKTTILPRSLYTRLLHIPTLSI